MAAAHRSHPFATFGLWALLLGALSMAAVLYQIAPPMQEPASSAATQIGEIAGEMRRAAWRSFLGLEAPEPLPAAPVPWHDGLLRHAGPALGILAVVIAGLSGIRGENWRYSVYGGGLGGAAILAYYLWWMALLIAGVVLLVAIIENIGDIFGGGLFGG